MHVTTLFADLNSYFASVEQQARPELRGKPIAVVPMDVDSTCCIAASYEAKAFGVKTGTRVGEARRMCPGLICIKASHTLYVKVHHEVIAAAETILPVHAVHSIDEFSCRLTMGQREPREAERLARAMKRAIIERAGECLRCSIGLAPNRFLAKVASDMQKPDGLVVIRPSDLPKKLYGLKLIDLPGIGPGMRDRLGRRGITSVEQLLALDETQMATAWESMVGRWWYMALRGQDMPDHKTMRRSIGHQHVLPPKLRNDEGSRGVVVRLLDKAAARARHLGYWAKRLTVSLKYTRDRSDENGRRWAESASFPECQDTMTLSELLLEMWERRPKGTPLRVSVVLDELVTGVSATLPLFDSARERQNLSHAMDAINSRFGKSTVYLGSMHGAQKSAPARIAFSNIPDLALPDSDDAVDDLG